MSPAVIVPAKYRFLSALRPFSFSVALIACLSGIQMAVAEGYGDPLRAGLILLAGLLLQAGVNLINDYADLDGTQPTEVRRLIRRNFAAGLGCFLLAALAAGWLILQVGRPLLWLCLAGLLGALGYTLKPLNYKSRGLGVPLVFWLMGVLMIGGSYLALSGHWSFKVPLLSIPVSLLVSLLLLSNELRDYEADRAQGIGTLTVRLGYAGAARLYQGILAGAFLGSALLALSGLLPTAWLPLLALPLCLPLLRLLRRPAAQRRALTPATGRLLLVFGLLFNLALGWQS